MTLAPAGNGSAAIAEREPLRVWVYTINGVVWYAWCRP